MPEHHNGGRAFFFCLILFLAWVLPAAGADFPPRPTAHYYGDADGNLSINLSDIAQHNSYSSFKPCAYDTLQPQTSSQYWNTCDVDSNRSCNLSDIAQLSNYLAFKPVYIGAVPWVLENVNLPLTGNAYGTWIPFKINLYSTYFGQPSGRPGISVVAEIDPSSEGTGLLLGRSCNPDDGTRDQQAGDPPGGPYGLAIGDQCALAVTITDWQPGHEGEGFTESGDYGFKVWGNGDGSLKIDFRIEARPNIDILPVYLSQTVEFNSSCTIDITCPPAVDETEPIDCTISYSLTCYDAPSTGPSDDCGGIVTDNFDGTGAYSAPAPGEAAGPGSCTAEVIMAADAVSSSAVVDINEVNTSPSVTVDCPVSVKEDAAAVCTLTPIDPDIPVQPLTCSLNPATTCAGAVITGCTQVDVPPQGESAGPGFCQVVVDIQDDVPAYGQGGDILSIEESSQNPAWDVVPSDISVQIGSSYSSNNGHATDTDIPTQTLDCINASDDCSFAVNVSGSGSGSVDCNISFTAGSAPESCSVFLMVTDGYGGYAVHETAINVTPCRYYVDGSATGAANGSSWADAFKDVQSAVDAASSGCEVWVAQGIYLRPVGGTEPVLAMKDGVDVYGGFQGFESDISQRGNPFDYPSVLDGEHASYHVATGASNAVIDGFTLQNGQANGASPNNRGGGMYVDQETGFKARNIYFYSNFSSDGGGIYLNGGTSSILNCFFDFNSANNGGAIYLYHTNPHIANALLVDNFGAYGGGIYNEYASPTISSCTLYSNSSILYGGAIYSHNNSNPQVFNSILYWNSGYEIYDDSGAVTTVNYSLVEGGYPGTGNIDADPMFVNPSGNYRLQEGSPCIDSGSPIGALAYDFDYKTRPMGYGYDMGAYEFGIVPTWFVDDDAPPGGDGLSWETAFNVIQDAMDAASAGEAIFVAKGNYYRPIGGNEPILTMKDGVKVYGGFVGWENSLFDRLDPTGNITAMWGENQCYHVVIGASDAVLDGFWVQSGSAPAGMNGGGIYNVNSADFTLANCQVAFNSADNGAGIYNENSSVSINNCVIQANNASEDGGGIYNSSSSVSITGGFFGSNNSVNSGGAISNYNSSSVNIYDCQFNNNGAGNLGGAVANDYAPPVIKRCLFAGNHSAEGGAISNEQSSPVIQNCIFRNGSATKNGGAIFNSSATPGLTSPAISNCSFTLNNATDSGGAIYSLDSEPTMKNCIFWGDTSGVAGDEEIVNDGASVTVVTYSDVQGGYAGAGNIDSDPLFAYPQDVHLTYDSPCIDAGTATGAPAVDFNGDTRPKGTGHDMGAYEYNLNGDWFVDDDAPPGGDGKSWATAFNIVQDAVSSANLGELIFVAQGTYTTPMGRDYPVLSMGAGREIFGGFQGFESSILDRGDPKYYPSYLDAEDGHYHTVKGAPYARLDGFYIVRGAANTTLTNAVGGGMYNRDITGKLIIVNCVFENNTAYDSGGAMYNWNATPTIKNTWFRNNESVEGGAIYNYTADPYVVDCVFYSNLIWNGMGGGGGAVFNFSSSPSYVNCLFYNNYGDEGGAVKNHSYSGGTYYPYFQNCTFAGNTMAYGGGAVYSENYTTTIIDSIIWGNTQQSVTHVGTGSTTVTYTNSDQSIAGTGNISSNPLFVAGPDGSYYLSQTAAGQASNSPSVNTGSDTAANLGLTDRTTRTDEVGDSGTVDMGYHYNIP